MTDKLDELLMMVDSAWEIAEALRFDPDQEVKQVTTRQVERLAELIGGTCAHLRAHLDAHRSGVYS